MTYTEELTRFVTIMKEELMDSLTGIYLHGSLAMGCFHSSSSDMDLLIIVEEPIAKHTARKIISRVVELEKNQSSKRGYEFSIVKGQVLKPFQYPTPFELHYSEAHRDRYEHDPEYVCGGGEDKDLAAHFVVALERGLCLYGDPLIHVCDPVPREAYVDAIYYDIQDAKNDILDQPVYMVLNLCRVLMFLQDGVVASKQEGGEWGIHHVPNDYQALIEGCLYAYKHGTSITHVNENAALSFADHMLKEIERLRS